MSETDIRNSKRATDRSLDGGLFNLEAEQSTTLPSDWYYDPEIYRREHDAIFYRTWWYQCHISDVSSPGDYFTGSIADQGIFIIRDRKGELHAFYNVCSHRAHPLLEGRGNTELIVCPYHQWCYQTDGCFRGCRGRDSLVDWIPENADLKPVRLEEYAGFLFVNLDLDAVPLCEQAARFLQDMHECCPRLDDLVRVNRVERQISANWKTLVDNNHECYHCKVNHKSLMELVDYDKTSVWSEDGITFTHTVERKLLDNSAYALQDSAAKQESLFGYIWPTTIPLFFPGSPNLVIFQILPTGPETSTVRHDFYFLNRELNKQEAAFMTWVTDVLVVEDVGLCESVQRGLHSRGYRQGRFVVDRSQPGFSEHHVHRFQSFVYQALLQ